MNLKKNFFLMALAVISVESLIAQNQVGVIPQPSSIERQNDEFIINQKTVICTTTKDADLVNVADRLNDMLKLHLGYQLKTGDLSVNKGGIRLILDPSFVNKEVYKMEVSKKSIEVQSSCCAINQRHYKQ